MKPIHRAITLLFLGIICLGNHIESLGNPITELPLLKRTPVETDWLIDASPYKAGVYRSETPGEIVLDNGLIRRTFRLSPNGATVGFDNLVTGEALLRSVRAEAEVTIDGVSYDVGGLVGQPNQAFILPEWIDSLKADPAAMKLTGFEVGEPQEQFPWKRVRPHAPNMAWPPKGVHLRMDYKMSDALAASKVDSDAHRQKLAETVFEGQVGAPTEWRIHASKVHERSSFVNEGKVGEIYTPQNTTVYAEQDLPDGVKLVEMEFSPGADYSASWGPAIAVVWENGHVTKFNMCTSGYDASYTACFGLFDSSAGELIRLMGSDQKEIDTSKSWTMRLRLDGGFVFCEAKMAGGGWVLYKRLDIAAGRGTPKMVRVGKVGRFGGSDDGPRFPDEKMARLLIKRFTAYGDVDQAAVAESLRKRKEAGGVTVSVHYELYDGIPCMSKWITVRNGTGQPIVVNKFTSEILAVVEAASLVCPDFRMSQDRNDVATRYPRPNIHVETDYAFGSFTPEFANAHVVHWEPDRKYTQQVNYALITPCLLRISPNYGPAQEVKPGEEFASCRAFIMPYDSYDRDRKTLTLGRMYRTLTPWVTENPLMLHVRSADWNTVKNAIDQCAEVGFEMAIMSFGSGFNTLDISEQNLAYANKMSQYGKERGVEVGSYALLSSSNAGADNIVTPEGIPATHGRCPSLASKWGQDHFNRLYTFYRKSGFMLFEHDGSYPGDVDVKARPPFYKGEQDSRWVQWRIISDFYRWCRSEGIFLNVPDQYYLNGVNKCGMGYREVDWSLPRAQQVIITRQNIYDGTWYKTPSMGWMFVPLTQYQGGGAAATIEPLDQHLDHYQRMLTSNLALGVQACYRGPRLYDTDRTKAMLKHWVDWFKKYRDILESDMIHGRRADGRDIDWMLHVNPTLKHKGMLVVFNPLKQEVTKTLKVPLYYAGLTETADVSHEGVKVAKYPLARDFTIDLPITIPAEGMTWFVIE